VRERFKRACGGRGPALLLAIVFALGLGLRLEYAIRAPERPVDDARAYARISRSLYEGEGFTQGKGPGYRRLQPASNYTPGLSLLTAGIYEVRRAPDEEAARIVLALFSSLAVPFAFFLGKRLGGPGAGLVAAVPTAIYPALLAYTGMLMTEPVGTALLAGTVLAFLKASDQTPPPGRAKESDVDGPFLQRRGAAWALAGVLLGAMAMLRPEYAILIPVLPGLALLRLHRRGEIRWERLRHGDRDPWRKLAPAALMAACACLAILPWTIRNFVVFDRFVPLSTGGGQVLYQGSYVPAGPDPERIGPVFLERHPWIRRELGPEPGPIYRGQAVALLAERLHPGEDVDTALREMAIDAYADAATEEPLTLAGFVAGKAWLAWTAPTRGVMRMPLWRALQLALLIAAAIGLVVGLLRRSFEALVLATLLLAVTLIQATFIASPRRTLMLLPEISALAGLGVTWAVARAHRDSLPP
jgi:4-amino-4-deoxy-L-arabinose transferase-like glycosyltransferase